jgi:hypothetical protein
MNPLHVGKPLDPISEILLAKCDDFKRRKLEICPNPPKIWAIS